MGAWGEGPFDNDASAEWLGHFLRGEDESPLYEVLEGALEDPELDIGGAGFGEQIIVAGEIVATLLGRPAKSAPDELIGWARQVDAAALDPELAGLARRALARVRNGSELSDLRAGDVRWLSHLDDLDRRLAGKNPRS